MNLYKIAQDYQNILEKIHDPETGEINENALALLDVVSNDVKKKGIAVAAYIKNIDAERQAIETAKKSMAARETQINNRVIYLTDYLRDNMQRCGINEISCPEFIIKLKKCPVSVDVINESLIPDIFKNRKELITIDKVKIKENLIAGIQIDGVALKQNMRIDIRQNIY
jgi:hypothetical protein